MLTTTIALLAAFSGPMQAGPSAGSDQLLLVADSAHTLFTPNAPDPGRAGQIYELPQGGFGVTTGGTSHYQTLGTPGGAASLFRTATRPASSVPAAGLASPKPRTDARDIILAGKVRCS